jgi:hypothetical protein
METNYLLYNRWSQFLFQRVQQIPEIMNFFKQNKTIEMSNVFSFNLIDVYYSIYSRKSQKVEQYMSMKSIWPEHMKVELHVFWNLDEDK